MASLPEFAAVVILAAILAGDDSADARELRPSDHGLVFQASPPGNSSPDSMRSFFSGDGSSSSSSSSYSDASSFPEASNFTGSLPPPWWRAASSSGGGRRFGGALVVASLVCGVTGVALLVATGLIYLFRRRRKPSELNDASFRSDCRDIAVVNSYDNDATNSNNRGASKLQLVAMPVVPNS